MSVAGANNDSALYGASHVAYRMERESKMAELTAGQVQALIRAGVPMAEDIDLRIDRLEADLASGALTEVLADFRPAPLPLSLLYPSNRQLSARVQVFIDWVTALMKAPWRSRHPAG